MTSERESTKINNKNELFEGMSPASRFMPMHRMLSDHDDSSKENTPRKPANDTDAPLQDAELERLIQTPPREEFLASPNLQGFSPNTRRILLACRRGELTDEHIKTPKNPFENIVTPDSAYGAGLRPGTRRMSAEVVNELNTLSPPSRRESDAFTVEENIGTPDSGFGAVLRPGTGCMSVESRKALWRTINGLSTEESFEWGNPSATCLPPVSGGERVLAVAAHRWRSRRQRGQPGPFAGVVALLHAPAPRRRLLARLVRTGQGAVVDEQPPYTDESITVCFADPKRYPMKERDRAWLASRRVPVCASILLSAFLTEESRPDLNQHCIPEFKA